MDSPNPETLFWAAQAGIRRQVKRYIRAGGDVDVRDRWGSTALHIAALNGRPEIVRLLREAGADVELPNAAGRTALDVARDQGRLDVVAALDEERVAT